MAIANILYSFLAFWIRLNLVNQINYVKSYCHEAKERKLEINESKLEEKKIKTEE